MQINKVKQQVGFIRFYGSVIFVIGLSVWVGYEIATAQHSNAIEEVAMLNQSMDNLMQDNQRLNSELNKRKIELDVQRLTNEKTQLEIRELLKNETVLKQQISFYQRVMAPETTQDGFVVERVEINATQSLNSFEVKLMLLQHENIKAVVKGTLAIKVVGSANSEPRSYSIVDLQNEPKASLDFGFKYFQVLALNITLPEGFEPAKIEIETDVYKYKRKRGSYSRTVDWSEAYASDERILD